MVGGHSKVTYIIMMTGVGSSFWDRNGSTVHSVHQNIFNGITCGKLTLSQLDGAVPPVGNKLTTTIPQAI